MINEKDWTLIVREHLTGWEHPLPAGVEESILAGVRARLQDAAAPPSGNNRMKRWGMALLGLAVACVTLVLWFRPAAIKPDGSVPVLFDSLVTLTPVATPIDTSEEALPVEHISTPVTISPSAVTHATLTSIGAYSPILHKQISHSSEPPKEEHTEDKESVFYSEANKDTKVEESHPDYEKQTEGEVQRGGTHTSYPRNETPMHRNQDITKHPRPDLFLHLTGIGFSSSISSASISGVSFTGISGFGVSPEQGLIIRNHFPLSFGAEIDIPVQGKWALRTGVKYARLRTDFDQYTTHLLTRYFHYLGVPLSLKYTWIGNKAFDLYTSTGGSVSWCVAGLDSHPAQWSADLAFGFQYKISPHLGLFFEPSLNYYFNDGSDLPLYYNTHPLSVGLKLGMSVQL